MEAKKARISLEGDLRQAIRAFREGRSLQALEEVQLLLCDFPEDRELLLLAAQCLRHLGRIDEALATLDRLEHYQPSFSHLHQERGLCYLAKRDTPRAIGSLSRAIAINPGLAISWELLEDLYRATGDVEKAAVAARNIAKLQKFPSEVNAAASLYADGEATVAEKIIRNYLARNGNHPEALRLLAKIATERGLLDEAERQLRAALVLAPDHRVVRFEFAKALALQHKYQEADEQAAQLLLLEPANKNYLLLSAVSAFGQGEEDRGAALCQPLLEDMPETADMCLWLGHTLRTAGRLDESVRAYRAAVKARLDCGNAYWSLANLKTLSFDNDDFIVMQKMESGRISSRERIYFCFALGKAFEDRGEFAKSWEYYLRGNALKRAGRRSRFDNFEDDVKEQLGTCTADFFWRRAGWGDHDPDPIFIVGLQRSGSTLLEQILASHSKVEGTYELAELQSLVTELAAIKSDEDRSRYPAVLAYKSAEEFRRLGERYLSQTRTYRTDRPYFIDKMPNNFRHVGLIHLMLPNAKIIDARREPMACCFSNFKQLFANGQHFTYDLEEMARYYRSYLDLMRHWDQVLPGRVLRVQHEDVVDDLEGSVRRILEYCGLEFEQGCIEFHKTQRNVRTPSSEQVRRPIFRSGLEQWKNYEPWLGPLKEALGDAVVTYRT